MRLHILIGFAFGCHDGRSSCFGPRASLTKREAKGQGAKAPKHSSPSAYFGYPVSGRLEGEMAMRGSIIWRALDKAREMNLAKAQASPPESGAGDVTRRRVLAA